MAATAKQNTKEHDDDGGFWGKDEEFGNRLDTTFGIGIPFIVHSIEQDTPFTNPQTAEVITTRSKLLCQGMDHKCRPRGIPLEYKTLSSPIYERAGKVRDTDFPAVCVLSQVPVKRFGNKALVLRKMCEWPIPDEYQELLDATTQLTIGPGSEDEVIPGD